MAGQMTTHQVDDWIRAFATAVEDQEEILNDLDGFIGDADHGVNLVHGMRCAVRMLDDAHLDSVSELLHRVGRTLVSEIGGASGALYGTVFLRMGAAAAGRDGLTVDDLAVMLRAALSGVTDRGKARPGDKTMVDALDPAARQMEAAARAGDGLAAAARESAGAAEIGARTTAAMAARRGRASYLGNRSVGHQDPGAVSIALLLRTLADTVAGSQRVGSPTGAESRHE